ncbi:hypothetical protein JBL43_17845 [Aureibaculum sp. A20]|uniref:Uncharacterized protein n=1 Tax=Aureibaculum flavum TaxID=2795986 RepID=A0ABS0WVU9_9FLAO|nr:hypothetical protein [Aureibaculum flavum]MBJ2176119.1 hypothetical protein [Aureibaculum flavum]
MKKSKSKLWKRILFGLIAFIFTMAVFIGGAFLKANIQKSEAAQLTDKDFIKEEVVVDSAYVEFLYRMPIPEMLRQYYEPSFAEITVSVKNSPIKFRSPQFIPESASLGGSDFRNINLKSGDTIIIVYLNNALTQAKNPNFLSNFYHRYKRPLVYNMSTKNEQLYDVGMDYDKYIDDKIHNECFFL